MAKVERTPIVDPGMLAAQSIPFGVDFQMMLLRVICEERAFASLVAPYLEPYFFENEVLAWVFARIQEHMEHYSAPPSLRVVSEMTKYLQPTLQPLYQTTIERLTVVPMFDVDWMKDQTVEFIRRNIFVKAHRTSRELYNAGQIVEAYDHTMRAMDQIKEVDWEAADRAFYFEEFGARQGRRMAGNVVVDAIPTGYVWLDEIMRGGLSMGELGLWIAYAKHGKSTQLIQHGVAATMQGWRNTLHIILEGSRAQLEDRYEAAFLQESYTAVKVGSVDAKKYETLLSDYNLLAKKLVVRGFVDKWEYTIRDVEAELQVLKRDFGWQPDLIIVDYGDLLRGRHDRYQNDTAEQKSVFRDLKSLANRGYAVWTACQARRPEKGAESKPHLIHSSQIADAYEKVRVADFIGSINFTDEEKDSCVARLYAELYRDNAANDWRAIRADWDKMVLRQEDGLVSPSMATAPTTIPLGYVTTQTKAM